MNSEFKEYLEPGFCVNSEAPEIIALAKSLIDPDRSQRENAVAIYYHVRDSVRYNPYSLGNSKEDWCATKTLQAGEGWCVPKAVLQAALCRAAGIPARLGYADVVNHLSTERLRNSMKTDVFYFHGYCSVFLDGKWLKSTPAFNLSLCEKFGLKPLEWDGTADSLYHEFDQAGNRHMEYVNDRGEYADVPYEEIMAVFNQYYPSSLNADSATTSAALDASQWEDDVERETQ